MSEVVGRNGRVYRDGKRVTTPVQHPETRDRAAVMKAAMSRQPKQPTGIPDVPVNPFEGAFARKVARLGHNWGQSPAGREERAKLKKLSKDWEAAEKAKADAATFQTSIVDLVSHAEKQVSAVMADETASVLDCEMAADALAAAKRGDRAAYVAWEQVRHDQVTSRLASEAAEFDSQSRAASEKRDAILAGALDKPAEVPEVKAVEYPDQRVTGDEAARLNQQLAETRQRIADGKLRTIANAPAGYARP